MAQQRSESGSRDAQPIRVLVVDDHPMMLTGVRAAFEGVPGIEVAGEARTRAEARESLERESYDVAIVDISLGDTSGLDLIAEIREHHPSCKVLVLSMHDEEIWAERALRSGALGYIDKSRPARDLVEALQKVVDDRIALSPVMTDRLLKSALTENATSTKDGSGGVASLTDRELQVFELLGKGLTPADIAEQLFISRKTVATHQGNIKEKLGADSNASLMRHAVIWREENT